VLTWPTRAFEAVVLLFRPTQDVDVYVEDAHSEGFYTELLRRLAPRRVRLQRVFPLCGRANVLARAELHDHSLRPALFLIDGDFEWVRGEPAPAVRGVLRLSAYCIENLLIDEPALVRIVAEETGMLDEVAAEKLKFSEWVTFLRTHLVALFAELAVLNACSPDSQTIGRGLSSILTHRKRDLPTLDTRKVQTTLDEVRGQIVACLGREESNARVSEVMARVSRLPNALCIVSGKDFLVPLALFRVRQVSGSALRTNAFKCRLMRNCGLSQFADVSAALEQV
jgi:hypothetical protein